MKKLFTLKVVKTMLLTLVMAFTTQTARANFGWYDTSITIGGATFDFSEWSRGNGAPDTDLGILHDLTISSVELKIWDDDNDRGGVNMFFRLYGDNGQIGGDVDVWLGEATRIAGDHDFSISYTRSFDLAEAFGVTLEAGKTYYLNMWAKSYGPAGDHWYNGDGDNYHTKIQYRGDYTRNVTSGNFGTICLPFDATVEGATVFKIVSKVVENNALTAINLESVESLEAGKAYIFKATEATLTATNLDADANYAAATEAFGMIGNLSVDDIVVPVNQRNFVVSDNQIHEVVSSVSNEDYAVTCGQYRAYITLEGIGEATARGANFIGLDESTGIESVQANNQPTAMFNLQGQRVTDAQKGPVIVNGKKMLRK